MDWRERTWRAVPYARRCRCIGKAAPCPWPCFDPPGLPDVPEPDGLIDGRGLVPGLVRALFGSATRQRTAAFATVPDGAEDQAGRYYAAALLLAAVLVSPRPRAEYLFIGPTVGNSNLV